MFQVPQESPLVHEVVVQGQNREKLERYRWVRGVGEEVVGVSRAESLFKEERFFWLLLLFLWVGWRK